MSFLFPGDEKAFASHWIIVLSVLSLALSVASFVTLLVDNYCSSSRGFGGFDSRSLTVAQFAFRVPPVFFTLCCCFYSLGFLLSQLLKRADFCIQVKRRPAIILSAHFLKLSIGRKGMMAKSKHQI